MPVVLVQRVLELELLAEEVLSLLRTLFVSVDPTVDVLRLDDEDAETRNDAVVDLGRPVRNRDCDIEEGDLVGSKNVQIGHDYGPTLRTLWNGVQ